MPVSVRIEPPGVAQLLEDGLEKRVAGDLAGAVACWKRALELVPGHPAALDYLEAAGARARQLDEGEPARIDTVRLKKKVVDAVRGRRYEDALTLLYEAQGRHPDDEEVHRSIRHMKNHIERRLLEQLGDLDRVVHPPPAAGLDAEVQVVLRILRAGHSLGDTLAASPIGRLRTLRVLARYFRAPTQADRARLDTLVDDGIEAVLAQDHARARKLFQAAAAIDPEHPVVRTNLQRLAQLAKSTEEND